MSKVWETVHRDQDPEVLHGVLPENKDNGKGVDRHRFHESEIHKGLCDRCGRESYDDIHKEHQPFQYDPVEAPAHYCQHKYTTAAIVHDWGLDFYLGNVLKYIERHPLKGKLEDLKKAKKYLEMEIELLETGKLEKSIRHG